MNTKRHLRLLALLLLAAMALSLITSVAATTDDLENPASDTEPEATPAEEPVAALADAAAPNIAPPIQQEEITEPDVSALEAPAEGNEDNDEWDFDDDWDGPRSDDGAPLTRDEALLYGISTMAELFSDEAAAAMTTAASSASATISKSTCVNFAAYTSPYWYCNRYYTDGTHKYGHYFYSGTIAYHSIDGQYAYCIEPNTSSAAGATYTSYSDSNASSSSYWMYELDDTQRDYIKKIMAFGYPSVDRGYSVQVQYAATQTLIWEVCAKLRYSSGIQSTSDSGLFNKVKATLGTNYQTCYNAILSDIASGISNGKIPSYAGSSSSSPKTINLTYNESSDCYEASVFDSNYIQIYFTFAADNVTFTRNGNYLNISVPAAKIDSVVGKTITATSTQKDMSTSNPTIWENSTYQSVLSVGGADYIRAHIKLSYTPPEPKTGTLKLVKKCSDSSITLAGWSFTITNNSTCASVTRSTDENGNITVTDLAAGTYTVSEKAYAGYAEVSSQTVTLESDKTAAVTFTNVPLKGNLVVTKGVNYGTLKGFRFHLHGTSTIGKKVDLTVATDSTGTATFSDVYVGTYTLEELDPGDAYLEPVSQSVTITADSTGTAATTRTTADNIWKYWRASVTKVDSDTGGSKQGDARLDGAEYTLYRNGKAVETYTVKNGTFLTGEFPCTDSDEVYTLKETKAPDGYGLNSTVYKLTTSYTHYTEALNTITLTVEDSVVKGKIQISKYAYNQISKDKQPETGAVFHVWRSAYGNYAAASDSEKDILTIGADGTATSKELPYGTYYLKQVSGWNGYVLDEKTYEVSITENSQTVTTDTSGNNLEIYNNIWTGELKILKVDGDTKTPMANAEFTLTGSDGSEQFGKTDATGTCSFRNLVYGVTYTWKETKAPLGYLLDEAATGTWTVSKNNDTATVTCENRRRPGSITVHKQDAYDTPLSGCTYLLEYWNDSDWVPVFSSSDGTLVAGGCSSKGLNNGCLTTGTDGTVVFDGLLADDEHKYRLTEISAPAGYALLKSPVFEGTLPVSYDASKITAEPDEVVNKTAYFYSMTFTVEDGTIYELPLTGGHRHQLLLAAIVITLFGAALCVKTTRPYWYRMLKRRIKNYF